MLYKIKNRTEEISRTRGPWILLTGNGGGKLSTKLIKMSWLRLLLEPLCSRICGETGYILQILVNTQETTVYYK